MDKSLMLEQLRLAKNIHTKTDFANKLGVSTQNLNNWYKRNVYDTEALLRAFPDLNPHWLITGEGEMLVTQGNTVVTGDISGNGNTVAGGNVAPEPPANTNTQPTDVRLIGMLEKTIDQIEKVIDQQGRLITLLEDKHRKE